MSRVPLDCSAVIDRLIEGERPASDPLLSEHVGSCLICFRTANDLKSLPLLRRQLLDAGAQTSGSGTGSSSSSADPGPAFWAGFPGQVSAAWESTRNTAAAEAAALVAARTPTSWSERWTQVWDATRAWLRLPVPAALGGALCAVAIILAATRPWTLPAGNRTGTDTTTVGARVATAGKTSPTAVGAGDEAALPGGAGTGVEGLVAGLPALAPTAGSLMPGGSMDDSLKELDVEGLWAVAAGLERTLADDVRARTPVEADEPAESNPTALSDDLEELNDAGLALLSQDLEGT
jgi:hypothetical protein